MSSFNQYLYAPEQTSNGERRQWIRDQVYIQLREAFREFERMSDFHLDDTLLREMGVDPVLIDIHEETRTGGPYFLPMSQSRLEGLEPNEDIKLKMCDGCPAPEFDLDFPDDEPMSIQDLRNEARYSAGSIGKQLDFTLYFLKRTWHVVTAPIASNFPKVANRYEKLLYENYWLLHPQWNLECHFWMKGFPHRSLLTTAGARDVKGLVKSEMMLVTGMMISVMKKKRHRDSLIVPLVLVSIIGRHFRVIQAHVSLEDQRLHVRYSQLISLQRCSRGVLDLIRRWILSSPLPEPKLQPEGDEQPDRSRRPPAAPEATSKIQGDKFTSRTSTTPGRAICVAG